MTAAALAMAQQVANFASAWPTSPQMVPTNEGGISVETHTLRGDISIDISSTGTVELFFLDASTGLSKDGPITAMLEDHGDSVVAIIVG